ncbi:MAG: NAD-dependent epimerase/dehydratase family protein [Thermoanaerobaculia bacterium]
MMKTFVTGATGLLGNNLVRQLRARGHDVTGLIRSPEKAEMLLGNLEVDWVVGDVRAPDGFASALEGCDVVFHTAAYFREYYQPGDHQRVLQETNVAATLALIRLANERGVHKFLHTGSSGMIGAEPDGSPSDEESPPPSLAADNLYFKSKLEAAAAIRAFESPHGMAVIEILPGWMWGPGDAGPTSAGQLALDFLAHKLPGVPPGGMEVVDARDVASAMIAAAERAAHGARYLVAGHPMTLGDIFAALEQASGVRAPRLRIPYALAMLFAAFEEARSRWTGKPAKVTRTGMKTMNLHRLVSSRRAESELGVTFRPFADTARAVVDWYRTQAARREAET